jgi:uncharacterized repeat protein (TIGR03803 family)
MTNSKSLPTLGLALACVAFTFSLAVCAQAQTFSKFAIFDGTNGSAPNAVIQATDGNLYGTTRGFEPPVEFGNVVRVSPTGEVTSVYTFCQKPHCADGAWPATPAILGSDGNLYGVTSAGGSKLNGGFGWGTVYKMTLTGQITTLHIFCSTGSCSDGSNPVGIMQASDGNLYGTTFDGGQFNDGTLFKLTTTGTFTILHHFCSLANCADGRWPIFPPMQGNDGSIIGTANTGGISDGGLVWALTPAGNFNMVHRFPCGGDPCPRGSSPISLVQDAKGNLFGVAGGGGDAGQGAIFEITAAHEFKILHSFTGGELALGDAGLTLANDGNIYGTTQGINGFGDIFRITPDGAYSILHTFLSQSEITTPNDGLFQATDGKFYGSALGYCDAAFSCNGAVYSLDNNLSPLVQTLPTAGKVGKSVLILGNGLSGTTSVTFNGVAASFTVESDTYIKAAVPKGATTGTVSVTTPSGMLNSNPQFVVTK